MHHQWCFPENCCIKNKVINFAMKSMIYINQHFQNQLSHTVPWCAYKVITYLLGPQWLGLEFVNIHEVTQILGTIVSIWTTGKWPWSSNAVSHNSLGKVALNQVCDRYIQTCGPSHFFSSLSEHSTGKETILSRYWVLCNL